MPGRNVLCGALLALLMGSILVVGCRAATKAPVPAAVTDVPLAQTPDTLRMQPWDRDQIHQLFDHLEFRVLRDRLFDTLAAFSVRRWPALLTMGVRLIPEPSTSMNTGLETRLMLAMTMVRMPFSANWHGAKWETIGVDQNSPISSST